MNEIFTLHIPFDNRSFANRLPGTTTMRSLENDVVFSEHSLYFIIHNKYITHHKYVYPRSHFLASCILSNIKGAHAFIMHARCNHFPHKLPHCLNIYSKEESCGFHCIKMPHTRSFSITPSSVLLRVIPIVCILV